MGVFQFEAGGKVYEVEAPDAQTAMDAFRRTTEPQAQPQPQAQPAAPEPVVDGVRSPVTGQIAPRLDMRSVDAAVRGAADTVTFGMADEIAAAGDTMIGRGNYDQNLEQQRARDAADQEQYSGSRLAGQVAGGLAGAGAALKTAPNAARTILGMGGKSLPGKMVRSAISGGGLAAAHGFGSGQGDVEGRTDQAMAEGALGAGIGAAAPVVGKIVGGVAGRVMNRAPSAAPSTEALKAQGNAAYKAAEDAGLWISGKSFGDFADNLAPKLKGIDPTLHPDATAAIKRISMARNQPLTLEDVDILRQIASDVAGSPKDGERRLGEIMKREIDGYLDNLKPADVVAGDPKAAAETILKARKIWSQYKKSQMIDTATANADLQTSATWSGGNIDNATRQKIKAIITNPSKARGFTPEEIAALEKVVRGGPIQNFLRLAGKLSPQGNGLMAALGLGATAANPIMAVAPISGMVAKTAADALSARNLKMASELIRRGAPAPKRGSKLWEAYAQLIAQAGGQGAAPEAQRRSPLQIEVNRPANWEQARPR